MPGVTIHYDRSVALQALHLPRPAKDVRPYQVRCDVCRRCACLWLAGLFNVDYRTKRFGRSRCGPEAVF
jgi:hypothetical protein